MACRQNTDNLKAAVSSLLEARGAQPVGAEKSGLDADADGVKVGHFCLCFRFVPCIVLSFVRPLIPDAFVLCLSDIRAGNGNVFAVFGK